MKVLNGKFKDLPDDFTGILMHDYGSKHWIVNGLEHRIDGPAAEYSNGTCDYYLNGIQISKRAHTKRTAGYRTTLGKLILDEHFKLEEK